LNRNEGSDRNSLPSGLFLAGAKRGTTIDFIIDLCGHSCHTNPVKQTRREEKDGKGESLVGIRNRLHFSY
jgi:hypothetical protein